MKTVNLNLYLFNELSNEAKQKAIESLSDINVDFDWWECTYDDASDIGLNITGFDLGRGAFVNGEFTLSANEVAQNILNSHGDASDTWNTANEFMNHWQPIFTAYMDESDEHYESRESEDTLQELESDFCSSLCEDYLKTLRDEYEYRTSEEAIIETITANNYYFTEDGKLSNL